jgi:uncharacterized repeat protein (TIGR03847 family)
VRRIVDVDAPDRITAADDLGAEDESCYVEVVRHRRRMSVGLEREQLARLARGILTFVDELERRGLVAIDVAPVDLPPEKPARRHAFRAQSLTIAWDDDGHRIVVEARSADPEAGAGDSALPPWIDTDDGSADEPDDAPLGPDVLRVRLTPDMAQRFARQAGGVAGARPRGDDAAGRYRTGAGP